MKLLILLSLLFSLPAHAETRPQPAPQVESIKSYPPYSRATPRVDIIDYSNGTTQFCRTYSASGSFPAQTFCH